MTSPALAFRHRVPVYYYARFNGLPYVYFGDGPTVTAGDMFPADVTYCPALRVRDQTLSADLRSGQPIGSGRAIDITLDADILSATGIYLSHFAPPTKITATTGAIGRTDTTINVESTEDFASSGAFYWGHERITYTGKTGTTFTGCTRGHGTHVTNGINYASAAPARISGIWGLVSDRPVLWRGRLVEIWAVAATPEGDLLGEPFTASSGSWRIWIGHVDGQPVITPTGFSIRALPAERSADRSYGWGQEWKVDTPALDKFWDEYIYWPDGGTIGLSYDLYAKTPVGEAPTITKHTLLVEPLAGKSATDPERVITVRGIWDLACALFVSSDSNISISKFEAPDQWHPITGTEDLYSAKFTISNIGVGDWQAVFSGGVQTHHGARLVPTWSSPMGTASNMRGSAGSVLGTWKMPDKDHPSGNIYGYGGRNIMPPMSASVTMYGGLFVRQPEEGSDQIYAGAPLVGQFVAWKQGDDMIVGAVKYVISPSSQHPGAYFIVISDVVSGDGSGNFRDIKELKECLFIAGQNTLGAVWSQVLTTSGSAVLATATAGSFGSADLLPVGWGARIPSDWLASDFATTNSEPAFTPFIAYDLDASALFVDAIALRLGITQTFTSDGAKVDARRMSAPQEADDLVEFTTADLMGDPIRVGPRDKPPNVVEVEFFSPNKPKLIIRNPLRIHAEGSIKKASFKVPDHWTSTRLNSILQSVSTPDQLLSDVYVYELSLTPEKIWSINVGDRVRITGEHYAFAAVTTGAHRGDTLNGRCVGVSRKLDGSGGSVRLAVWGEFAGNFYAPDSAIYAINAGTKTITLPGGHAAWFWVGATSHVLFYDPGNEGTYSEVERMASSSGDDITFLAPLPSWLTTGHRIKFPTMTHASTRQAGWAFVNFGSLP